MNLLKSQATQLFSSLTETISGKVGDDYFKSLVGAIGSLLGVDYVFIAEIGGKQEQLATTRAVYAKGSIIDNFDYEMADTPCEDVREENICFFPKSIQTLYPKDYLLQEMNIEGYVGASLDDSAGHTMGVLVILTEQPISQEKDISSIFKLVVGRTSAELARMRTEETLRRALEESERIKEELQKREAELVCHIENTPLGCISWDLDFCCTAWNSSAENIFGYSSDEAIGKHASELIVPPEIRDEINVIYKLLLKEVGGTKSTNENTTKSGKIIIGDWYNTPIKNRRNNVIGVTSLVLDITKSIENEKRLEAAKIHAEEANFAKSNFLANLSHEFRTPLNAILGYSDLMMHEISGPVGNKKYIEHIKSIHHGGGLMLDLVNDILDISAIETRERKLTFGDLSLNLVIKEVLKDFSYILEKKGIKLTLELKDEIPIIQADARAIHQILNNLLSNASKFTGANGQILVSTSISDENVVLEVSDDGIGIPADSIKSVVEPFVQASNNAYLAHEGTGLGLSIVKSLVEFHNGKLEIDSAIDKGTTIRIILPIR